MTASVGSSDKRVRRADRRVALLLSVCFVLFYLLFARGFFHGSDEVGVFEATRAIYERGDLSVPAAPHTFTGKDGRTYNHFALGQSLLALPLYGTGKLAGNHLPRDWVRALAGEQVIRGPVIYGGSVEIFFVGLYSPFVSGLLVGLFFLFERRLGVSVRSAVLAAVLLGVTTYVAAMSIYFLRHTTETLALLGAFYCFFEWRRSGAMWALGAGSCLASSIILIRIPMTVVGPILGGYLVWTLYERLRDARRQDIVIAAAAISIPLAAALVAHGWLNHAKWGTWIASPMLDQHSAMTTPLYVGLFGFLLSPGCSIFVFSPLLLLAPRTMRRLWSSHRAECVTILALCVTLLLFHAKFEMWHGLWSAPGPRYVFAATPLLMLALGPWLDGKLSIGERASLGLLAAAGAAVQFVLMGARWGSVTYMMQYEKFVPAMSLVYIPDKSPIVGSLLLLLQRRALDTWLWNTAAGWPGWEGQPGAVAWIVVVWALCLGTGLALLRRTLRAHPG